jgi:FixJ family two-component response regulator
VAETRKTISIIDDDASVRRALQRLVRSLGLNVEAFATAEDFLQPTSQPATDCLVLDVNLPGLSGLELQERMRAEGRGVPIVFITAYGTDRMRERALRAGAIAFLEKPFQEQALLAALARAVG